TDSLSFKSFGLEPGDKPLCLILDERLYIRLPRLRIACDPWSRQDSESMGGIGLASTKLDQQAVATATLGLCGASAVRSAYRPMVINSWARREQEHEGNSTDGDPPHRFTCAGKRTQDGPA